MPTLEENVNRVKAAKTAIGDAITAKGGTVGANDGLEDFASDIASIPSGGGVEFSNTPAAFTLLRNIQNLNIIIPSGVTSIGPNAFYNCTGLTSIEIPNGVTSIDSYAFSGCTGLTSIEIPNSVTIIGDGAFSGCTGLTSIEIPNGVTSIGSSALSGLNIENLEIPNSVTTIKSSACASLRKLKSLKFISSTPPTIYANAFNQLASGCKIYVPSGSLSAYTAVANMPSSSTYTYIEY